jgi:hypothetical protein
MQSPLMYEQIRATIDFVRKCTLYSIRKNTVFSLSPINDLLFWQGCIYPLIIAAKQSLSTNLSRNS